MTLPNFIIAGAPKSGSSSLWQYLRQHPDIFFPLQKELFFFDFNFEKGLEWYEAFFDAQQNERAIGEATVWYMRWNGVPEKMNKVLPGVKLIFLLRHPVDRAYSNWCHEKRDGIHPFDESFERFLTRPDRDSRTIISSGYYARHLRRFLSQFPETQIHVCLMSDLRTAPDETCRKIFQFLDVDDTFQPDLRQKDNVSWWFRGLWLLSALKTLTQPFDFVLKKNIVDLVWSKSRHFRSIFWQRNKRPPKISENARALLLDHYAEQVAETEQILGRDLSDWKR